MRSCAILAILAFVSVPATACDITYPADYVAPPEELISQSEAAFVGHVVGYRLDDGSLIEKDVDCEALRSADDFKACWEKRGTIVSAILSVDIDIRGMNGQQLFEDDRSAEPAADCGNYYADDTIFLVTGFGPQPLKELPSRAAIQKWQSLPAKRVV